MRSLAINAAFVLLAAAPAAAGDGAAPAAARIFAEADSLAVVEWADGGSVHEVHVAHAGGEVVGRALAVVERGKHGPITVLVAVDSAGAVREVEILSSRERRGKAVERPPFLKQFRGRRADGPLRLGREVDAVTGATVSSRAVLRGVARALAILAGRAGDGAP